METPKVVDITRLLEVGIEEKVRQTKFWTSRKRTHHLYVVSFTLWLLPAAEQGKKRKKENIILQCKVFLDFLLNELRLILF